MLPGTNTPDNTNGEWPTASLTADVVVLTDDGHVLLVRRADPPYQGQRALPGGYLDDGETFAQAAARELLEETGVHVTGLRKIDTYDAPHRDPRGRVISVAFVVVLAERAAATAGDDASHAEWVPLTEVRADPGMLAFDHARMVGDALALLDEPTGQVMLSPVALLAAAEELAACQGSDYGRLLESDRSRYLGMAQRAVHAYLTGGGVR